MVLVPHLVPHFRRTLRTATCVVQEAGRTRDPLNPIRAGRAARYDTQRSIASGCTRGGEVRRYTTRYFVVDLDAHSEAHDLAVRLRAVVSALGAPTFVFQSSASGVESAPLLDWFDARGRVTSTEIVASGAVGGLRGRGLEHAGRADRRSQTLRAVALRGRWSPPAPAVAGSTRHAGAA